MHQSVMFDVVQLAVYWQVWFDDPHSLRLKYQVAVDNGLRGVGFWNLDCLDYHSENPLVMQQTGSMWDAVRDAMQSYAAAVDSTAST